MPTLFYSTVLHGLRFLALAHPDLVIASQLPSYLVPVVTPEDAPRLITLVSTSSAPIDVVAVFGPVIYHREHNRTWRGTILALARRQQREAPVSEGGNKLRKVFELRGSQG